MRQIDRIEFRNAALTRKANHLKQIAFTICFAKKKAPFFVFHCILLTTTENDQNVVRIVETKARANNETPRNKFDFIVIR